ncbi:MAG: 4Fe-4S binding protein [Desulfovibrio sp.]
MNRVAPLLASLALALLGAHALRLGQPGLSAACLGLITLAWGAGQNRAWVRLVLLAVLVAGFGVWLQASNELVRFRVDAGLPWLRLAAIMGAVCALTLAAILVLLAGPGRRRYALEPENGPFRAVLFLLVAGLLVLCEHKVRFPLLLLERYAPGWGGLEVFVLACYAQWIGGKMLAPRAARKIRPRIWGLFSVVFFLQLGLGLLGLERMLMTGALHLPVPALIVGGPVFRAGGWFMLILYLSTVLLVGPAWCSHLCYVGAWDDAASRLGPKRPEPGVLGRRFFGGRVTLLARGVTLLLTVFAALGLRLAGVPGSAAVWLAVAFALGGVAVMLTLSRRSGSMVHCSAYCPIGLVGNLLGRLLPWRMRMNQNCTRCGVCATACRYGALQPEDVEQGRPGLSCTLCGDCMAVCAHRAMEYRFSSLRPATARKVFLVLVVALHAVFLGLARI